MNRSVENQIVVELQSETEFLDLQRVLEHFMRLQADLAALHRLNGRMIGRGRVTPARQLILEEREDLVRAAMYELSWEAADIPAASIAGLRIKATVMDGMFDQPHKDVVQALAKSLSRDILAMPRWLEMPTGTAVASVSRIEVTTATGVDERPLAGPPQNFGQFGN